MIVEHKDIEAVMDIHKDWIEEDGLQDDEYMVGMYNGMVVANSAVEDEEVGGEKGDLMDLESKGDEVVKEAVDIFVGDFA
jgi:hypothetical protein